MHVLKYALIKVFAHSIAKDCLRTAENVVIFLTCILVVAPSFPPPPPPPPPLGYATALLSDGFYIYLLKMPK